MWRMRKLLVIVAVTGLGAAALDVGAASAGLTVCIKDVGGAMRAVSSASDCNPSESSRELATTAELQALEERVETLETLLAGVSREGDTLLLSGVNLQLVNGSGQTSTLNGVGNLIVGYNADENDTRTGSHNLVIGDRHTYTSHSGLVSGGNNTLSGLLAVAAGGSDNTASGAGAFIGGGIQNDATGLWAFVGGGNDNTASGSRAFVGGGLDNHAGNFDAFVGGGNDNDASGGMAFVGGGESNTASGFQAFVGGGLGNRATEQQAFVGGGWGNDATGIRAFVGGGQFNTASGSRAFVGGGSLKTAGPGICAWLANVNVVPC